MKNIKYFILEILVYSIFVALFLLLCSFLVNDVFVDSNTYSISDIFGWGLLFGYLCHVVIILIEHYFDYLLDREEI